VEVPELFGSDELLIEPPHSPLPRGRCRALTPRHPVKLPWELPGPSSKVWFAGERLRSPRIPPSKGGILGEHALLWVFLRGVMPVRTAALAMGSDFFAYEPPHLAVKLQVFWPCTQRLPGQNLCQRSSEAKRLAECAETAACSSAKTSWQRSSEAKSLAECAESHACSSATTLHTLKYKNLRAIMRLCRCILLI
jgi:hypothetical protein